MRRSVAKRGEEGVNLDEDPRVRKGEGDGVELVTVRRIGVKLHLSQHRLSRNFI